MPVGKLRLEGPRSSNGVISRTVLVEELALHHHHGLLWATKLRGHRAGFFPYKDNRWLVELADFITLAYRYTDTVLTRPFLQTSGPLRIRDRSTFPGSNCRACAGT